MAKIYVSPETLKKLSASDDYLKTLNRFGINRPEQKRHSKTNKKENNLITDNSQSKAKNGTTKPHENSKKN